MASYSLKLGRSTIFPNFRLNNRLGCPFSVMFLHDKDNFGDIYPFYMMKRLYQQIFIISSQPFPKKFIRNSNVGLICVQTL